MRENLGLQVAVILFAALCVVLSVSTYVYWNGYLEQRDEARQTAERLHEERLRTQELFDELQAVKHVVTENESARAREIQQTHAQDVHRSGPLASPAVRPTYQRLVGHLLSAVGDATAREFRTRADLLALQNDLDQRTQLHGQAVAVYQNEAQDRERQFAHQRAEDETERQRISTQMGRLAEFAEGQSGELAQARLDFDHMQRALTERLTRLNRQYDVVRDRWEATQVDRFEHADGRITVADARSRSVQIDLGSADGLRRGVLFQVYDPSGQGIVRTQDKGTIEITKVTGEHTAEGRIVQDTIANPILSRDLVFSPLWQAGVQRQFCLLGILDIDGDGRDDGETVRTLLDRQNAEVEAEVDADGRPHGELTAACRYVVVGKRPLVTSDDAPSDAYDRMLSRAAELGIDQISIDKLLDYLEYRPARVAASAAQRSGSPTFQPRYRSPNAD